MIEWNRFDLADHLIKRDRLRLFSAGREHHAVHTFMNQTAQAVPRRVASQSIAEGVPPRCRYPRIVTRDSSRVSASS